MPKTNQIVEHVENGKSLDAHNLIEGMLAQKVIALIEEKKKAIVARVFGKKTLLQEDSKAILKRSKRKALKMKMEKLKKGKK